MLIQDFHADLLKLLVFDWAFYAGYLELAGSKIFRFVFTGKKQLATLQTYMYASHS